MKKWSIDILNGVETLLKEGKTYDEIGLLYNKSGNAIRSKLNKLKKNKSDYWDFEKNKTKYCLNCGKEIKGYKKFCNNSCAATYNNTKREIKKENVEIKKCLNCGNDVKKGATKFCSYKCLSEYKYKNYITKWKNNEINGLTCKIGSTSEVIRRFIFEKYENKCARCGWHEINPYTGKIPLQVEHIDGNYANNNEENLILLCPSCHSLTPTYGARNKGNGRPRYKNLK